MKRHLLIALIVIVSVGGCRKQDDSGGDTNGKRSLAVEFSPAYVDVALTKAGTSFLPLGELLDISVYPVTVPNIESVDFIQSKKYIVINNVGKISPQNGDIDILPNTDYKFYAYSPQLDFKAGSNKTISVAYGTDFKVCDVRTAVTVVSPRVDLPPMIRKCANAQFIVQCIPDTYIQTVTIGSSGLTFNNMTHSPIDYTLGEAAINLTNVPQDASYNLPRAKFLTPEPNIKYVGEIAVLPKVDNPFTLNIDVQVNGAASQIMSATVPRLPFVPGYSYQFTLLFSDKTVMLVLKIQPWVGVSNIVGLGSGTGTISITAWNDIVYGVDTGSGGATSRTLTPLGWAAIVSALTQGLGDGLITVGPWNPTVDGINTQGEGGATSRTITPLGWDPIGSALTQGLGNGLIVVGAWSPTLTWNTDTGTGTMVQTITIDDWTANPNWAADLGAGLSALGITAWSVKTNGNTNMGE